VSSSLDVRVGRLLLNFSVRLEGLLLGFFLGRGGEDGIYHDTFTKRCVKDRCTKCGETLKQCCGVVFPLFRCPRVPFSKASTYADKCMRYDMKHNSTRCLDRHY